MLGDIVQPTHLLFILVVALLVLGPKRLPEVGRSLGRGLRDFRQGMAGVQDEARSMFHDALDEPSEPTDAPEVSAAPEPLDQPAADSPAQPAAESLVTSRQPRATAATATATKASPVEPDPAEYAD